MLSGVGVWAGKSGQVGGDGKSWLGKASIIKSRHVGGDGKSWHLGLFAVGAWPDNSRQV